MVTVTTQYGYSITMYTNLHHLLFPLVLLLWTTFSRIIEWLLSLLRMHMYMEAPKAYNNVWLIKIFSSGQSHLINYIFIYSRYYCLL